VSDQSVHAQDIRHSVVTGDGNSITATFGNTGVRLPLERRQVPVPDRRRPPRPSELPRELDILLPTAGTLPERPESTPPHRLRAFALRLRKRNVDCKLQ
jgi:hypothetical protein